MHKIFGVRKRQLRRERQQRYLTTEIAE